MPSVAWSSGTDASVMSPCGPAGETRHNSEPGVIWDCRFSLPLTTPPAAAGYARPMVETFVPAVFARGGTSKGLFFREQDLPAGRAARDAVFLSALGSPDPHGRQLDGMGGGLSSLSKVAVLGAPTHPEADVDYTFGQVSVDSPVVDYGLNCGNMASAVAPVALRLGLVSRPDDGPATVRIHATNTGQLIEAALEIRDGQAVTDGGFALDGVAGTGAPIRLAFLEPGGAMTGRFLPTGNPVDVLEVEGLGEVEVSLVDAANPVVFVAAEALAAHGLPVTAAQTPEELEAADGLLPALEDLRRAGAVAMGLAATPEAAAAANPKIAVLWAPQDAVGLSGEPIRAEAQDLTVRMVSMGRIHRAVTSTGALCMAAAAAVPETLTHRLRRVAAVGRESTAGTDTAPAPALRIGHPSGVTPVSADVCRRPDGAWDARTVSVFRTARILMRGEVAVRG